MKAVWIGSYVRLSRCFGCSCDAAFQGQTPCSRKIVHTPSEVSDRFPWTLCLGLARLEDPHVFIT
jgi:hypothetical protein